MATNPPATATTQAKARERCTVCCRRMARLSLRVLSFLDTDAANPEIPPPAYDGRISSSNPR